MRLVPGAPEQSTVLRRLSAVDPLAQMPPLGRHLADREALNLIEEWVKSDLASVPVATNQTTSRRP